MQAKDLPFEWRLLKWDRKDSKGNRLVFNCLGLSVWSGAGSESGYEKICELGGVTDPHHIHINADPDPPFHFDADQNPTRLFTFMRIRIWLFTLMRISILLLIKVIRICYHLHTDPPRLCERSRPSTATFWASTATVTLMRIRFNRLTSMRIPIFAMMQIWIRHPTVMWIHADPDPQHNPWLIITMQKIYFTPIISYQLTFEYLLVENSVPEDVQRDPGHIQRENHQRELLPQNPDSRLELT
jgi:hypothetical protein